MDFVLDENMVTAVRPVLEARGHHVVEVREHLPIGATDVAVATFVDEAGAVLVTFDLDFRELLGRRPAANRLRWRMAGRVVLTCNERHAARRLNCALHLIEAAHAYGQTQPDPRVLVDVGGDVVRVER